MRIGCAPDGCLRGWLTELGHRVTARHQAGLVSGLGHDTCERRIVFPLDANLYGRSLSDAGPPYRALRVACMLGRKFDSIQK